MTQVVLLKWWDPKLKEMPRRESASSQITVSCILLALCTGLLTVVTISILLGLNEDHLYDCATFHLGTGGTQLITLSLNESLFRPDSNVILLPNQFTLTYGKSNSTTDNTWHITVSNSDYSKAACDSEIPETVEFCVVSNVSSMSCLPVSYLGTGGLGISLRDPSSDIFYYYIFDLQGTPSVEKYIYDNAISLLDIWSDHYGCGVKTVAMLVAYCVGGVLLLSISCCCFCLCSCIRRQPWRRGYEPISTRGDDMGESEPLLPDPATHPAFEIPLTASITHQMGLQRLGSIQAQGDSQFIKPTDPSVVSSEMRLRDLCWIPFDVRDKTFGAYGGRCDLETHSSLSTSGIIDEDHIILEFPPNAVDPGTAVHVRYAIIPDGPFRVPTGYRFGSMVVYLVVDGARLKIPMMLHLPHWLTCVPSNRSLVKCLRAPHSLETGQDSYSFSLIEEGTYNITDTASTIQVDGDNCLFAVAHEEGIKERYQYQKFEKESLEKQEKEICIYITFFTLTWLQIVKKYCKRDWQPRETPYRTSFSISDGSDALEAAVSPASDGQFWSVVVDGIYSIPIQLFDFTSELAIGNAPSLKSAVENHLYPPAFTYRVVQNEAGRDCRPKKRCVHLDLSPTQPAVKIPIDVIDYVSPNNEPHPVPYENELSLPSLKYRIIPTVAAKWRSFGTYLGVEYSCLQMVKNNFPTDCGRACEEMLKLWLAKDIGTGDRLRTWATVISALEKEGYIAQARGLRNRLLLSHTI